MKLKQNGHCDHKASKKSKDQKNTLGPIPELEGYVQPDWWKRIFNSLYLKTDADVVNDQKITKEEVDLICNYLALKPDDRILDICCGQGRHVIELSQRGFYVEGLDRSRYLISRARSIAKKNLWIFVLKRVMPENYPIQQIALT